MGIRIDNLHNMEKVGELYTLVKSGRIGDSTTFLAGTGYKHLVFHFVKMSKKTVNAYGFDRSWFNRTDHKKPLMKITKDHFHFLDGNFSHTAEHRGKAKVGCWSHTFRGFISMGLIPNAKLRYLRNGTLVTFNGYEVATHYPMKVNWEGDIISRIPKAAKLFTEKCYQDDKDIINRNARANYGNTRVLRLIREAEKSGNWDKIHPIDVFSLRNVADRTELIEHFGYNAILDNLNYEVVDKDEIDGRKYELLRFEFPDGLTTYLKMINPSTDEICIEGVPNNIQWNWHSEITMNKVKEALAWRDGDEEEYLVPMALT